MDDDVGSNFIRIGNREVGPGRPVYIVAELSGNHNGSIDRAIATIRAAAQAGADAVKLQTYTADTITLDAPNRPDFIVQGDGPWQGRSLYDLYDEAHTPWEWHQSLFDEAHRFGLDVFSTPFDSTAVDFLEGLGVLVYKIASFELIDDALLKRVAETGKPVIMSTGMASLAEIEHAVGVLRKFGSREILLLKCTSSYPAPDESMNLRSIESLAEQTGCTVGLSDHSTGLTASVVAVGLGACLIEKHLTISRADGGVDSHFSLEPSELRDLVVEIRRAEKMLGSTRFGPGAAEEGSITFRRSLYSVKDIRAGEPFTTENVRSIRPGYGLPPRELERVLASRAKHDISRATPLSFDLLLPEMSSRVEQ